MTSSPIAWIALALGVAGSGSVAAAEEIDFARDVWPILERSCVECHRAPYQDDKGRTRRPKGDLRLDGRAYLLGSAGFGAPVVPGDPAASSLYERVTLDPDDPERMPKDRDPLAADEVERLRRWIADGARFGEWRGAGETAAEPSKQVALPSRFASLERLSADLRPLDESALRDAAAGLARIEPLFSGGSLYRVQYLSHEAEVGDAQVAALVAIAEHVTDLRLSRTAVSDAAMRQVAKMRRLTRLDLSRTEIGDSGVAAIVGLPELRWLNLFGTDVGDASVDHLASITSLRELFLHDSEVSDEGVARLRKLRPDVRVQYELSLPSDG